MPHEVNGELTNPLYKIMNFTCSCKAGASECCKHFVSILLLLNRTSVDDLETLSSTDIKCQWSKLREPTLAQYKPKPIDTFDCFKKISHSVNLGAEVNEKIRSRFIACAPNSSIALHTSGRHLPNDSCIIEQNTNIQPITLILSSHSLMNNLKEYPVMDMGDCCKEVYSKLSTDTLGILNRTLKDKTFWESCRKYRITGSRCYNLYTFNKCQKTDEQWSLKASRYFWPKSFTNKYVKHGIEYENIARNLYIEKTKQKILECGLRINPHKWLSYTSDGVITNKEQVPIKIIEIKCPFLGKNCSLKDIINDLKYIIKYENGLLGLKTNHSYYA